jgi:hypothetical protein
MSGSLHFFLSHFMTLMLLHPPLEARESLYITCEACIHASEDAQVLDERVGMIEYLFYSKCIFGDLHQLMSPGEGGSRF